MKKVFLSIAVVAMLAACKSESKTVIILSNGTAEVNTNDRVIDISGKGHEEKTVQFFESSSMDLTVKAGGNSNKVTIPENGIYLLNTKVDTFIGSYVNYAAPKTEVQKLTEQDMRNNIDSLESIINGKTKAGVTFYVLPGQAVKITANSKATIITPYHQMTSMEKKEGETPEVYRFYPISEARATLEKLKGMMGEGNEAVNDRRPPKK